MISHYFQTIFYGNTWNIQRSKESYILLVMILYIAECSFFRCEVVTPLTYHIVFIQIVRKRNMFACRNFRLSFYVFVRIDFSHKNICLIWIFCYLHIFLNIFFQIQKNYKYELVLLSARSFNLYQIFTKEINNLHQNYSVGEVNECVWGQVERVYCVS